MLWNYSDSYYGDEEEVEREREAEREDYDDYIADHCNQGWYDID